MIKNGIDSKINGTHTTPNQKTFLQPRKSYSSMYIQSKCVEVSKATMLPKYSNGVTLLPDASIEIKALPGGNNAGTLIQAKAVVLENRCIQQVSNMTKNGCATNILAKDLLQKILNGNGDRGSDFFTF
jgi:hypothetical protein